MSGLSRRNMLRGQWRRNSAIRPPWSLTEAEFTDGCVRCNACVEACDTGVLIRGGGGFPEIDFKQAQCTFCGNCAKACDEPIFTATQEAPWQYIALINDACLSLKNIECRSCQDSCEPYAIKFKARLGSVAIPIIEQNKCNGCGACVKSCPVGSIRVGEQINNDNQE